LPLPLAKAPRVLVAPSFEQSPNSEDNKAW
jgi:hypothetical protein